MLSFLSLARSLALLCLLVSTTTSAELAPERQHSGHTNNWAVLVSASRYWFNYRHMSNALGMYRTVKRLGIPDSNVILMLADDVACNARNKFPGCVYHSAGRTLDLYGDNIEVDYGGNEVTVENFLRVLTGRVEESVPRSKRLLTDDRSNVFVFMTGHGGNEFLKFQDQEELSAFDVADAIAQMWEKKRYNELFFMIDTCQANSMYSKIYSPNVLATGSSVVGENSYSYENDYDIGVSVIDSYTHCVLDFMEGINKTSHATLGDLFDSYDPARMKSHPGVRSDLFRRPLKDALVTDFFGGVAQAEVLPPLFPFPAQVALDTPVGEVEDSVDVVDGENATDVRAPAGTLDAEVFKAALRTGGGDGGAVVRTARTWGASAGVVGLVAWVVSRRK
ncbi:peptidase C13 family-domain-containing protein [Epithele typhae]|uniref:peptidase C13 family-domain-containing protein n=1 Tax=Epithele typhae TaxID=378194 RepID=UPI0020087573|nr:peptidase C13 family-domain-containing protein [Epithele typhae]KAH9940073.1 peptidase C13 family-domain-containing protein [Epithele typhae]